MNDFCVVTRQYDNVQEPRRSSYPILDHRSTSSSPAPEKSRIAMETNEFQRNLSKYIDFDSPILKTIITSIVLRTTSIAGKYATYTKELIKQYKTVYVDRGVIVSEFMLVGWFFLSVP